ncbi:gamma-glutamylcyclotransferase family protein [Pseudogemmobacter sp. W21_MBD1_M6]|uniref:gamma-glutamylcyclotransferase family protein n=1 Tax=Pseudogemmobacter sp. W21_MBD1_M6 TaxID=3240271 RepID=UPI003F95AC6E
MVHNYFFGYGSLVNRQTHGYGQAHPAHLTGWRRVWRHTALRPVAFLTGEPAAGTVIDGLIAHVPNDDWAALDEREFAYDRIALNGADLMHPVTTPIDVQIYAVPAGKHGATTAQHPILLSYLDAVVQGYLTEFGEDGARRFFDTTGGWDAPILNDRHTPQYPRAQRLTKGETAFVDSALAATGKRC